MLSDQLKSTLKLVTHKLNDSNLRWALVGSANLALQGIDVEANGVDILVHGEDRSDIVQMFSDFHQVNERNIVEGLAMKFLMNKMEVEFNLENEKGIYRKKLAINNPIYISIDDVEVPCLNLDDEMHSYIELGRTDKADLVKKFLENRQ